MNRPKGEPAADKVTTEEQIQSDLNQQLPTFPSSRASTPRVTRALRGGRMKAGGSLPRELHPGDRPAILVMVEEGEANRTSLILLSERKNILCQNNMDNI